MKVYQSMSMPDSVHSPAIKQVMNQLSVFYTCINLIRLFCTLLHFYELKQVF